MTKAGSPHPVPPDGGWGWLVLLGTTACTMILSTQGPSFGILFGPRFRELQAPPSLPVWIYNMMVVLWNLAGSCAGPLSARFSYRKVAATGAFMSATSLCLSSLVSSPYLFLITFSILHGIGGGVNITCCYHMIAKYFSKHLGVANSIMMAGASLGIILLPQLASYLQEIYPFTWAARIIAAVILNSTVASLLFHPVEWHQKKVEPDPEVSLDLPQESMPLKAPEGRIPRGASVPAGLMRHGRANMNSDLPKRIRTQSESQKGGTRDHRKEGLLSAMSYGGSSMMGSVLSVAALPQKDEKEGGVWQQFKNSYNLSVLKYPLAVSVAVVNCITLVAAQNIFVSKYFYCFIAFAANGRQISIPFVLHEAGYTLQESATVMSVAAVVDLTTRVAGAFITDLPQFKPRVLYGLGQLIFVVVPYALFFWLDRWFIVTICAGAFGMGFGIIYILDVLLMVRLVGVELLQAVFGVSQLCRSVAYLVIGPVGGVIRESTGTFWSAYSFYSSCMFVAFLSMVISAYTCQPKQDTEKDDPA